MALIDQVKNEVMDDSGRLTDPDHYQPAIDAALERYSRHKPRKLVRDVAGTGTHDLDLPTEWVSEFSSLEQIEYPVGNVPEDLIDGDDWTLYETPADTKLRLLCATPEATETVRVTFTVIRAEADVPAGDTDAVVKLAASVCCEFLANLFASTNDPTIAADVVNYRTKSSEYAARAKRLRKLYFDHMGIDEDGGTQAASVSADTDRGYPWGGDRMTHSRRSR